MAELRKYNVATTILFPLIDAGAQDFESTPVSFVAADTQISKDEGAFANTDSTPAHEGNGIYSLALTATEMAAGRIVITVIDAATKAWEDQAIIIDTYGNASAQHAFDLDTASTAQTGDSFPRLPAALVGGRMDSDIGAKTGNVALSTQEKTDVNAEVNDVINVDAKSEAAAVPGKDASLGDKINFVASFARNGGTHNRTTGDLKVNNDAGTAIGTAPASDTGGAGGTLTRGKMV